MKVIKAIVNYAWEVIKESIAQIFTTDIFLHHLLVHTGHRDGDERPCEDLLQKKQFTGRVAEDHLGEGQGTGILS